MDKQDNAGRDTLNANNLIWIALVVGGIVITDWLLLPR